MSRAIFRLSYSATCRICNQTIPAHTEARRLLIDGKPGYVCMTCAPVTRIPDGTAEGAVDASKASLKAKAGRGRALKTGVPMTISKPGKRKRMTGNQRTTRNKHSA